MKELWFHSGCWLSHKTFDWCCAIICWWNLQWSYICWSMLHWCLLLPSIHNISARFLFHFSLRRWRRRNRALWRSVPECLGLVFQTGGRCWLRHTSLWRSKPCLQQRVAGFTGDLPHPPFLEPLPLLQLFRCPVQSCPYLKTCLDPTIDCSCVVCKCSLPLLFGLIGLLRYLSKADVMLRCLPSVSCPLNGGNLRPLKRFIEFRLVTCSSALL